MRRQANDGRNRNQKRKVRGLHSDWSKGKYTWVLLHYQLLERFPSESLGLTTSFPCDHHSLATRQPHTHTPGTQDCSH